MRASAIDLRRNMKEVVAALDRNESVTLTYRGKEKAQIVPNSSATKGVREHAAFGLWKDRADLSDVESTVRELHKGRQHGQTTDGIHPVFVTQRHLIFSRFR